MIFTYFKTTDNYPMTLGKIVEISTLEDLRKFQEKFGGDEDTLIIDFGETNTIEIYNDCRENR